MIIVKHLTKKYGRTTAVDDISFRVKKGEVVGFLGPNGAGKTTTMNMITGYLSSTSGSIRICGHDILDEPLEVKKRIGYLPEQPPIYLDMTVEEYLRFVCRLKKCSLDEDEHIDELCEMVKLTDVRDRLIKNLSKGYRQRVGIAQALVGNPPVLILDEPTVGLDPSQIVEIRSLIKKLGKRHTIILSTHILSEVQIICDRVVVINQGKIVADSTTTKLSESLSGGGRLLVTISGKTSHSAKKELSAINGVKKVSQMGEKSGRCDYVIDFAAGRDVRKDIFDTAVKNGWTLLEMKESELSLEEIFLRLTGEYIDEDEEEYEEISDTKEEASERPDEPEADETEEAAEAESDGRIAEEGLGFTDKISDFVKNKRRKGK